MISIRKKFEDMTQLLLNAGAVVCYLPYLTPALFYPDHLFGTINSQNLFLTEIYLKTANKLVDCIHNLVFDMMRECRDMYINGSLDSMIRKEWGMCFERKQFQVFPIYSVTSTISSNYDPVEEIAPFVSIFPTLNEWILTDENYNPIDSSKMYLPHFLLSKAHSAGILSKKQAIIQAFLSTTKPLTKIQFRSSDRLKVHIDGKEKTISLECERWKNCTSKRVWRLANTLIPDGNNELDENNYQLYFICQSKSWQTQQVKVWNEPYVI